MNIQDLPTERRLAHIHKAYPAFTQDDLRTVYYACQHLILLKKFGRGDDMRKQAEAFSRDDVKPKYRELMLKINALLRSRGYPEDLFRNPDDFQTSSDDYDYYYELKTEKQLKEEEERRTCGGE